MKDFKKEYEKYIAGEKKLNELYHKIAMQIGISDSVLWTLYCLFDPNMSHTQNDIAQKMGVAKQTINSAVNRLLKEEYVYLEQMAAARNNKQIFLTEKGKKFCKEYISPVVEAEEKAFNRLSEKEQEIYLAIGIKHNEYLKEKLEEVLSEQSGENNG